MSAHREADSRPYCGRFAPSPSGPLHAGSLLTALGSWLEADRNRGRWLLRIDDIDPPREQAGASAGILHTLEQFGFQWHGPVIYQSTRLAHYRAAMETLRQGGHLFGCACTRREIANLGINGPNSLIYPGTCRNGLAPGRRTRAWRVRCGDAAIRFRDQFQGTLQTRLADTIGDFVVRRADGHMAYHLAAAVDDGDCGITHLVRGHDLLWCTPPQQYLQQLLGLAVPACGHLPVVVDASGQKLSKQSRAAPLDPSRPVPQLWNALSALRQDPPADLRHADLHSLWAWARKNWRPQSLQGLTSVPAPAEN